VTSTPLTADADPPGEVPGKIVAAIDRLSRARRLHRQAVASAHGLTVLQIELLTTLSSGVPAEPSVAALAREIGVTAPTASDSLRVLGDKGLVSHRPAENDRHRKVMSLTADGARLAAEAERSDHAAREAVARLDSTEQDTTLASLLDIIAGFVDVGVIDVARTCTTCRFHQMSSAGNDHCTLLQADLAPADLRVNCPEHVPTSA